MITAAIEPGHGPRRIMAGGTFTLWRDLVDEIEVVTADHVHQRYPPGTREPGALSLERIGVGVAVHHQGAHLGDALGAQAFARRAQKDQHPFAGQAVAHQRGVHPLQALRAFGQHMALQQGAHLHGDSDAHGSAFVQRGMKRASPSLYIKLLGLGYPLFNQITKLTTILTKLLHNK